LPENFPLRRLTITGLIWSCDERVTKKVRREKDGREENEGELKRNHHQGE
jgi:hypothetical protein